LVLSRFSFQLQFIVLAAYRILRESHRLYRFKILKSLGKDLNQELAWVNKVSLEHLKNYQIWYEWISGKSSSLISEVRYNDLLKRRHHRQLLMSDRELIPNLPPTEQDFLMQMFKLDAKNYHVWTYR